jgi:hypothetical protein
LAKLSVLYSLEIVLTFRHSQAKQQAHEQEMRNLALKAKEEARRELFTDRLTVTLG